VNRAVFVIALVFGFMLAEWRLSRRHERLLRAEGAIAPPGDVYRAMAVLYPAAFLLMGVEGIWRAARSSGDSGALSGAVPSWLLAGALMFAASKALKVWAIGALGTRWSFRVYVQPGRPLVSTGPYRYVAHPNYVAVLGELVGTAMMEEALLTGPIMIAVFGAVLIRRIRFEEGVLAGTRRPTPSAGRPPAS
jgi:methyltransferase